MAEEKKKGKGITPEQWKQFEEQLAKTKKKEMEDVIEKIATREKLERDFREDILKVVFETSPETKRMVLARRPTHDEMIRLIKIVAATSAYNMDTMTKEEAEKLEQAYAELPKIAAKLCIDKKLNEEFWSKIATWNALQNFLNAVIAKAQEITSISPEEMKSFR